ncbi:CHASE2 domain-containing protein [Aquibium microcysteis]|uniref:CHASE2 domain-containing protein n=1 Tax=Aquibium microcysteis TaxID=675281 RepID=UPI00165D1B82|nr:adenylate/guanylate cyclase domain-containing protein [Aquibium microcysteis]
MTSLARNLGATLRRYRRTSIWAAGVLSAAFVILAAFSPFSPVDRLNAMVFDGYQAIKPRQPAGSPVTVIDIDDASIGELGQWPWPRTVLARIIATMTDMGAASIGLDMLLAEPDRTSPVLALQDLRRQGFQVTEPPQGAVLDNDAYLADVLARSPVIAGLALAETTRTPPPDPKAGFGFGGLSPLEYLPGYEGSVRNLAVLDAAAPGIGLINFPPARDGVVRQIPLIARYGEKLYPALSMESLRIAQGASSFVIRSTGAHGEHDTGLPGMVAVKNGHYEVPTSPDATMWVYFSGQKVANVVPAAELARDTVDPALADVIAGHIVLIGTSAIGLRDLVSTPLASGVPGVLVHAEIIDQILGGTFLSRPDWAVGAEVALAVVLTILVLAFLPALPALANALVAAAAIAIAVVTGWLAFAWYNMLLSPILPAQSSLLAYGIASGVRLLVSESERRYIRSAFSHYLAPSMVEKLMDNPQSLVLGGENKELTLLFADIRGFTTLSEKLGANELTEFLNNYLTPMTDVLMERGATIDKYMGDGIMAFWNAPLDVADHRRRACESVLAMQAALVGFNRQFGTDIAVGVGLNTGICCVGNLGSRQRFDYSAIGDPVNVAARIEGMTKQYGLSNLISGSTAEGMDDFAMLEVDRVKLVGRAEPTPVYTLLGQRDVKESQAFRALKARHDRFLAQYRSLDFDAAEQTLDDFDADAPVELAKLYKIMRGRLAVLRADPPPAGWDGTYTAREK